MSPLPSLSTKRLLLRPLTPGDSSDIFSIFSSPEVTRFSEIETLTEPQQAHAILDALAALGRWGITIKGSPKIIGTGGLTDWNQGYCSATVGYDLGREYWGKGIMTEALAAILGYGFTTMKLNRVNALTYPDNIASIRVLERHGFKEEGVMRQLGFWKGEFHDMRLFSLLRKEWRCDGANQLVFVLAHPATFSDGAN